MKRKEFVEEMVNAILKGAALYVLKRDAGIKLEVFPPYQSKKFESHGYTFLEEINLTQIEIFDEDGKETDDLEHLRGYAEYEFEERGLEKYCE